MTELKELEGRVIAASNECLGIDLTLADVAALLKRLDDETLYEVLPESIKLKLDQTVSSD